MDLVERIQHTNAWSRRHPGEKLLLGGGLLLLSLVLPVLPGAILVLAAALAAALALARIRAADYFRVLMAPLGFLLMGSLALAVSVQPGEPWVGLSQEQGARALDVLLRAMAATAALFLIVLTVPLSDGLGVLRRLKVPAPLLEIALLTYRLIGLAIGVAERMRFAQASRLGYGDLRRAIRSTGVLAASLLPRVLDRARRMEVGLAARAYAGDFRTLAPEASPSPRFVALALCVHGLIVAVAVGWSTPFVPLP